MMYIVKKYILGLTAKYHSTHHCHGLGVGLGLICQSWLYGQAKGYRVRPTITIPVTVRVRVLLKCSAFVVFPVDRNKDVSPEYDVYSPNRKGTSMWIERPISSSLSQKGVNSAVNDIVQCPFGPKQTILFFLICRLPYLGLTTFGSTSVMPIVTSQDTIRPVMNADETGQAQNIELGKNE